MTSQLIQSVIADLRAAADPAFRDKMGSYFSMNVENFLGVRGATIRKIAATHWPKAKPVPIDARLALCHELLDTKLFECKTVAFDWMYRSKRQFEPKHFKVFATWLDRYVDDWNDCDDLSTHVLGEFFLRFPDHVKETSKWARSRNRWVQRSAAVSLIPSVREGSQLEQAFAVADALLETKDDLLQKGYGWLLKEASKSFQREVFAFILQRKDRMPRTALRYAIEKMPPALKKRAMA